MKDVVRGFTLVELVIVIAIVIILSSLAISAYQTYTVRAQVTEGVRLAAAAKAMIIDSYTKEGVPPVGRVEAGMSPAATDTSGAYVSQIDIANGRIDITFGKAAHPEVQADTVSLTPYVTGREIAWRCGNAPAPPGLPMSGGGITAVHVAPTVDPRYLPSDCR